MRIAVALLSLAALGIAIACTSAPAGAGGAPAGGSATIELSGFAFKPATLEVAKGTTVSFVNKDSAPHTATSGTPGKKDGKFGSSLQPNATATVTLADVGTYDIFCEVHPRMTARVTVK